MSHVWFVSIPGTSPKVWSGLNAVTEAKHLSSNSKYEAFLLYSTLILLKFVDFDTQIRDSLSPSWYT